MKLFLQQLYKIPFKSTELISATGQQKLTELSKPSLYRMNPKSNRIYNFGITSSFYNLKINGKILKTPEGKEIVFPNELIAIQSLKELNKKTDIEDSFVSLSRYAHVLN